MKEDIFNTNPIISTTICSVIGIALVGDLTAQEQMALGNWLMLIAQELVTNATSQSIIQSRAHPPIININSKEIKSKYNPIVYDIKTLMEVLKKTNITSYNECISLFDKTINKMNEEINKLKD